jgi:hypothetical protein
MTPSPNSHLLLRAAKLTIEASDLIVRAEETRRADEQSTDPKLPRLAYREPDELRREARDLLDQARGLLNQVRALQ